MSKRALKVVSAGLLVAGVLALAACAPQTETTDSVSEVAEQAAVFDPKPVYDLNKPIVVQYPDGTLVQRTPSEDQDSPDYNKPALYVPSNTFNLKADTKGCNACHPDLGELVYNMSKDGGRYDHYDMRAKNGTNIDVDECMSCHALRGRPSQTVEGEFGNLIHGIHEGKADCWNCHAATDATGGMAVWDNVKYTLLRGIKDVEDVDMPDTFSYRTDEIFDNDKNWTLQWFYNEKTLDDKDWNEERSDLVHAGQLEGDPEVFNNWTIKVSGLVNNEMEWKLPDLIAQGPSETRIQKHLCAHNPTNGPWVYQGEWTGIPITWILEQAGGIKEGAVTVDFRTVDGGSYKYPIEEAMDPERLGMICYQLNGQALNQIDGYPIVYKGETRGANDEPRWITDIVLTDQPVAPHELHGNHHFTKPNVGIFDLREGQVFKTGEPIQFHGYAESYNQKVIAVEISMDRGKTWKRFETPDSDLERLMTWTYDWTPKEAGSYTLYIRGQRGEAIHPNGDVEFLGDYTEDFLQIMFTVADELPEPDVVLEEGDLTYNG